MGTIVTEFTDQLFSFMAFKYEIVPVRNQAEGAPLVEDYHWTSDRFSVEIGHAVMMLSYTYRPAFRRHFKSVAKIMGSSKKNAKLYAIIFAIVTYKCHSPLKILVICAFISEMYLFMYFQTASGNASRRYTIPCINCFNNVYKLVFSRIDDPILKWNDVKHAASLVAEGYSVMEPIMNTEHPSENKPFFNSVTEVLLANARIPEAQDSPEVHAETTNEPSTSASQRLSSKNDQVTKQSVPQASATNASVSKNNQSPIGDQSKPQGKKGKKKLNLQILPKSGASVGISESESTASASGVDERVPSAFSFGTVDQITSRIPGFNEQKAASLEYDHIEEKTDKSSEDSNREIKARSVSRPAKSKSKNKRRNSKK